ncbi:MAG: polyprenyl synthetase family protein [Planctomycetota bacterium]|nr:MAG: polyprenyl synthetase family protein [Planctomycetota bacterium]
MSAALRTELKAIQATVEAELDRLLPPAEGDATRLREAMRYSTLGGGKRVRPALCLLSCAAAGGERSRALPAACALEMIHVYSLVHDDLPAMDDDDLRRGRPTCHKAYGEATGILVGDGLQALAFEVLAREYASDPPLGLDLVGLLAQAAGAAGMVGGQALDMAAPALADRSEAALEAIHAQKTGALLRAAVLMGARCAGTTAGSPRWASLDAYARAVGLAFQVADDILDCTATTEALGKTAGKDQAQDKLTYVALLGLEGARAKARSLEAAAGDALAAFGPEAAPLRQLAHFVVSRTA